jgi:ABC-type glycerol-3-phosphate transport system substrate-binding protein
MKLNRIVNLNTVLITAMALGAVIIAILFTQQFRGEPTHTPDGRVIVHYWEKWSGFEQEAMARVVEDFNSSQDRILVKMLSVSMIEQKLMLATAGGDPPDVAGIWSHSLNVFAGKGALTPLDSFIKRSDIRSDDYLPVFWKMCQRHGFTWALPTTPATLALHWNKQLFQEAGLDPEQPPRSLQELEEFAEKLTVVEVERNGSKVRLRYPELTAAEKENTSFKIVQLGYTPSEPGWYDAMWTYWFDGNLWDGKSRLTADSPENLATLQWYQHFPRKYGLANLQEFGSSFGNFASPQNPFLSGKVAMVLQGVWMHNFIEKYSPELEWKAAPFPAADPTLTPNVTIAESDVLVIPKGARQPKAAFEFIRFVNTQPELEKLNLAQRKFSPLTRTSADFVRRHPNPCIQVFIDLAASPNARAVPRLPIWNEYKSELLVAYNRAFAQLLSPHQALQEVQKRCQWKLDRRTRRWDRIKDKRQQEWNALNDTL